MDPVRRRLLQAGGAGPVSGAATRAAVVLALPFWLAACSPPGWIDPAEWFSGPAAPPERIAAAGMAEPGPYPSLGSMPEEVPRPSLQYQRNQWTRDLAADRDLASYTVDGPDAGGGAAEPSPPRAPHPVVRPGSAPGVSPPGVSPPAVSTRPVPPGPVPGPPPRSTAPADAAQTVALPPIAPPIAPPGTEPGAGPGTPATPGGPAERGELVGVIYFLDGSTRVDARDRRVLGDIVLLQQQRGGVLHVIGHASRRPKAPDPAAHRLANFALSLDRARTVALALTELGAGDMEVVAASDSEPVYDESQPTGEAGNRRVEIFLEN
ncbi:MAG: OmpA family protein [Rhodospirillales bacterium]|nr:OmpA family protein [Rhodospirillales bacterium]